MISAKQASKKSKLNKTLIEKQLLEKESLGKTLREKAKLSNIQYQTQKYKEEINKQIEKAIFSGENSTNVYFDNCEIEAIKNIETFLNKKGFTVEVITRYIEPDSGGYWGYHSLIVIKWK